MKSNEPEIAEMVGRNIAKHRNKAGLTQEELGVKLGVGGEAVSRMERALSIPSLVRLFELAEILECDVIEFLTVPPTRSQLAEIQETLQVILAAIKEDKDEA